MSLVGGNSGFASHVCIRGNLRITWFMLPKCNLHMWILNFNLMISQLPDRRSTRKGTCAACATFFYKGIIIISWRLWVSAPTKCTDLVKTMHKTKNKNKKTPQRWSITWSSRPISHQRQHQVYGIGSPKAKVSKMEKVHKHCYRQMNRS
jgi:hypothetical protein